MYHEVEDHGHVGAARIERRQPMRFHEQRVVQPRLARAHRAVEALDVTDLHDRVGTCSGRKDPVRCVDRGCDRLLDQHVHTARQRIECSTLVRLRRHGNDARIDLVEQCADIVERRYVQFLADLRQPGRVAVMNPDEFAALQLAQDTRMVVAECTDTDDRGADAAHTTIPRRLVCTNSTSCCTSAVCSTSI